MNGFNKRHIVRFTEATSVDNLEILTSGIIKEISGILPYVEMKKPPIKTGCVYISLSAKNRNEWANNTFQNSPYIVLSLAEIGGGRFKLEIMNMAESLYKLGLQGIDGSKSTVRARLMHISNKLKNEE